MNANSVFWMLAVLMLGGQRSVVALKYADFAVGLPPGVKAVWDLGKAYRETTSSREKVCINGLWRWQPAVDHQDSFGGQRSVVAPPSNRDQLPVKNWGYFKVPGCWPGITDYMQKDFQTVHAHPSWSKTSLPSLSAAWYERTVTVPKEWDGRRITLLFEQLNSYAAVFLDGTNCGEIRFPGGEIDLTTHARPGNTHVLSLFVVAMPLSGVMLSYSDSNSARELKGQVERRGLCGDVFLVSTPARPRLGDGKIDTSVRQSEIALSVALEGLAPNARYMIRAGISKEGQVAREFSSRPFTGGELVDGRIHFVEKWKPEDLWDLHRPANQYELTLSLADAEGRVLDTQFPLRFGFREFWIDGRDFYLNGSRIFLCAVPLDNAQVGAAPASYDGARESLERLKAIGINFVYTHNYGCEPGSHLGFEEVLRAADDVGMLVALSQPHFSHYDWRAPGADQTNRYALHAAYYARVAQNHPSVVAYAMSHNATGYEQDMNPDMIDGLQDPRDNWSRNNAKLALRAEAIVKQHDPGRIVYHHASGNLGSMHPINFYPNFVPIQEMSDWFEHWATKGVKPVFTCEYAAPFTWDWTMYRGWYKGQREFGSAAVPWEYCLAEWNSQFLGDRAFRISEAEARNLRWEARQFRAGKLWHRWDYPHPVGSPIFDEQYPVIAMYIEDNWRAFRTWGVSAISPWEYGHYWKVRDGVDRRRKDLKVDWEKLQRPGFSADYIDRQYERMDLAFERSDWAPTAAARALLRNNGSLLAYVAGKPSRFTSKDHIFLPGETLEKQLIVINNSRETLTGETTWSFSGAESVGGKHEFSIETGEEQRVPLRFVLPEGLAPGRYQLKAHFQFSGREEQSDSFSIDVMPPHRAVNTTARIALFDSKGETGQLLKRLGVQCQPVDATTDLAHFDILIVGKAALTTNSAAPDIRRVRDGLKVIVFEQRADVLERRFGFRIAEYGLRQVFPRVPDHPALDGIAVDHWRDWRGEATILPARLDYRLRPRYGPTVDWCGIPVPRLWRCGNRGNVASVFIEKPARGDFLPILDGGYSLQYSPLIEYRNGRGMMFFCQVDVTGRTESDPVAETLARNILRYVSTWKPAPIRSAVYVGEPAGKRHLESAGFVVGDYDASKLSPDQVLVVGPGGARELVTRKAVVANWLKGGGKILVLGLEPSEADALPIVVTLKKAEHIAAFFESNGFQSAFRGIGPADIHNRDPRQLALITSGAAPLDNGVLAIARDGNIAFCQLLPWQFVPTSQPNLKRTFRRTSFLATRLLANWGVPSAVPVLERFHAPVRVGEQRWLEGLYLDQPEEWDDPYRFFRW